VPIVAGALLHFQLRGYWQTEEDYEQGYNAFAELQVAMSGRCITDLVESQNRIYRLLDTALNGVVYTASGDVPPLVTPEIPAVPVGDIGAAPGLRAQLLAAQGTINAGWFGIGGQPATMADLVNALRIGSEGDTTRITNAIDAIAGDSLLAEGSQAANIIGLVKGLFTDVAGGIGEGAVLGTLIASSIATSGMLGVLAGQIDRLIAGIDGGGDAPADNVLVALRGTTVAGEMRNVIDSNTAAITDALDPLDLKLTDIVTNTATIISDDALLLSMLTNVRDLLL
jgi:hypothetical protein